MTLIETLLTLLLIICQLHMLFALEEEYLMYYVLFVAFDGFMRLELKRKKEDCYSLFCPFLEEQNVPYFLFQVFNVLRISRMLVAHNDKHKFIVFENDIEFTLLHM